MTKQELGDLIIAFTDDFYRIAKAILKEDASAIPPPLIHAGMH